MIDEVDILIRNVNVLRLDDRKPVLHDSGIAIKSGRIAAIGRELAHVDSKQELDGKQKVAMPRGRSHSRLPNISSEESYLRKS